MCSIIRRSAFSLLSLILSAQLEDEKVEESHRARIRNGTRGTRASRSFESGAAFGAMPFRMDVHHSRMGGSRPLTYKRKTAATCPNWDEGVGTTSGGSLDLTVELSQELGEVIAFAKIPGPLHEFSGYLHKTAQSTIGARQAPERGRKRRGSEEGTQLKEGPDCGAHLGTIRTNFKAHAGKICVEAPNGRLNSPVLGTKRKWDSTVISSQNRPTDTRNWDKKRRVFRIWEEDACVRYGGPTRRGRLRQARTMWDRLWTSSSSHGHQVPTQKWGTTQRNDEEMTSKPAGVPRACVQVGDVKKRKTGWTEIGRERKRSGIQSLPTVDATTVLWAVGGTSRERRHKLPKESVIEPGPAHAEFRATKESSVGWCATRLIIASTLATLLDDILEHLSAENGKRERFEDGLTRGEGGCPQNGMDVKKVDGGEARSGGRQRGIPISVASGDWMPKRDNGDVVRASEKRVY
ncbi:hypothetical protein CYLTODRAFT_446107 [Cylindrobasidium torrendii FP15055 ss-10]|uniref:Uncharacterized protein n=1 Tax=Cylindrobasidium torrendii FP15055 ss-10 TaxID=1314674 RepID=A0A0D7B1D0_9AGAR|nr:hypothetical protein CYLTODRAFT_446107 [Cylindrobasidium torrendii FP15055 ss-10]